MAIEFSIDDGLIESPINNHDHELLFSWKIIRCILPYVQYRCAGQLAADHRGSSWEQLGKMRLVLKLGLASWLVSLISGFQNEKSPFKFVKN